MFLVFVRIYLFICVLSDPISESDFSTSSDERVSIATFIDQQSRGYKQDWDDYDYELPKIPIGVGKFGEIYKIRNKKTRKLHAVKIYSQSCSKEAEAYHRELYFYEGNSNKCDSILRYLFSDTKTENQITNLQHSYRNWIEQILPCPLQNSNFQQLFLV